ARHARATGGHVIGRHVGDRRTGARSSACRQGETYEGTSRHRRYRARPRHVIAHAAAALVRGRIVVRAASRRRSPRSRRAVSRQFVTLDWRGRLPARVFRARGLSSRVQALARRDAAGIPREAMTRRLDALVSSAYLVATVWFVTVLCAQSATGVVAGRVTDPSGGVMPGVTVTLSGGALDRPRTTTTNVDGTFRLT